MFERFAKADGGPDTRGAIWYDDKHHNIFVADHGKGLWKINECSNTHGDTSSSDAGLWDISHDKEYIFAVGKDGLSIYNEDGVLLNTLSGIDGEGLYVKDGYAYIVNAGTAPSDPSNPGSKHVKKSGATGGIIVVNVKNINNPHIVKTVLTGEQFSQIRGGKVKVGSGEYAIEKKVLYVSSLDGKLYLLETNGASVTYKDDITIFPSSEARKIFSAKKEMVYVNSNFGELAVVKVDKDSLTLSLKGTWQSSEGHGKGQQSPAAGGVFVTEIKDGKSKRTYALITAADGNSDGYLYWLDVTDPSHIKKVDSLHDTEENYGFNDIWVNDTRIYLAAHNGFTYMGMEGARNIPVISVKDSDGSYKEDINVTQNAMHVNDNKIFYAKVSNKNASNKLDLKLKGPTGNSDWEYRYYLLSSNEEITDKIGDKGYVRDMDPGESFELKIVITPISENAVDATVTLIASNKESKDSCGKPSQSDKINLIVTFDGNNAFTCDGTAYIFTSHASKNDPTDVYTTDIVSGNFDLDKSAINPTNINAIGYNITDNYIWGYDKVSEEVKRIDRNYRVKAFKISGLPEHGYHAGDISKDGILYLFSKFFDNGKKIYKVDVNPDSSTYLKMVGEITLPKKIYTSDFAFHPKDNQIYYAGNSNLFKIDTNSGKIYDLGNLGLGGKKIFIGTFFDNKGYFYIQENSGNVYRIDITDPSHPNPKAEKFSTFDTTHYSDGARCTQAPMPEPSVISECQASFQGAVSSTKDEIQLHNFVHINHTVNHMLTTKKLKTGQVTICDGAPCQKSGTLAPSFNFNIDLGNGDDGDLIKSGKINITEDKKYQKIYIGPNSVVTISDTVVKIQKDFQLNQKCTLNINGDVTIYADKFQLNQYGKLNVNGTLKVIVNEFYINSTSVLNNEIPQNFVVLAKKIIDINNKGTIKAIFYSDGDIKFNNANNFTGAVTGAFVDINNNTIINYDKDAVADFCGIKKTDKPKTGRFNIWDQNESIMHQVIKTKIVDADIKLTFASLNEEGNAFIPTESKDIKIALFSPTEQLTIWHTLILDKATHVNMTFTSADFAHFGQQHKAFKVVKAIIQYKDSSGKIEYATSSDTFAIRPKHYDIVLENDPSKFIAGKKIKIGIVAESATGAIVSNYNETADVYDLEYHETKNSTGCRTGELNITKGDFVKGIAVAKAIYDEVGILNLSVHEVENHNLEFANIDRNDTLSRYISPDYKESSEFSVGKLVLQWDLLNGANHYTFFSSDPLKMGAELGIAITAQSADGKKTENFNQSCYAKDVSIDVTFQRDRLTETLQPLGSYLDSNKTIHEIPIDIIKQGVKKGHFTYAIEKERFHNALANKSVKLNFLRYANKPIDPLHYEITKIEASVDNLTLVATGNQNITYLYARAYAPNQSTVGDKMKAKIFYEVYCKSADRSSYGLESYPESVDSIYWYILPKNEITGLDFSAVYENGVSSIANATAAGSIISNTSLFKKLEKIDNEYIELQVKKTPARIRLSFKPEDYLLFDPYKALVARHYFTVSLNEKPREWAGRGKSGATVDTQINSRNYFDTIDW